MRILKINYVISTRCVNVHKAIQKHTKTTNLRCNQFETSGSSIPDTVIKIILNTLLVIVSVQPYTYTIGYLEEVERMQKHMIGRAKKQTRRYGRAKLEDFLSITG